MKTYRSPSRKHQQYPCQGMTDADRQLAAMLARRERLARTPDDRLDMAERREKFTILQASPELAMLEPETA